MLTGEGADELFAGYDYIPRQPEFTDPDALQAELVRSVKQLHHLNLQRCDRTTMDYGMEAREPFLDSRVVGLALSLPAGAQDARAGREAKELLRDAFEGWLPEETCSAWQGTVRRRLRREGRAGASGARGPGGRRGRRRRAPVQRGGRLLRHLAQ